jgi:hypothetical protein
MSGAIDNDRFIRGEKPVWTNSAALAQPSGCEIAAFEWHREDIGSRFGW